MILWQLFSFRNRTEFKMGRRKNGLIQRQDNSDNDMDSSEVNIPTPLAVLQESLALNYILVCLKYN